MKNRMITAILFYALAMITFVVAQDDFKHKAKITWKKITRFAERNKGKIIAGGIAVLAAGLGAGAVAYVNQRANKVIADAGLTGTEAKSVKTFMLTAGLTKDMGISALASDKEWRQLMPLSSGIVHALAWYWGMEPKDLETKLVEEMQKKKDEQ